MEEECSASGDIQAIATIFLTNRECPFRCVMCDLWRNTMLHSVPSGAIREQIDFALDRLPQSQVVKLYNSGSFFDPHAIPPEDYESISERLQGFERVIVECHPAFVGDHCAEFRDLLAGRLEIAMGLETAHPGVLQKLNKQMTLPKFAHAADFLRSNDIDLRVFILVQPPFLPSKQALEWAKRSLDLAFDCGAVAATLIPTRGGNGAMEELAAAGEFAPPGIALLEAAAKYGVELRRGRVFTDLWNFKRNSSCAECFNRRVERLRVLNLTQRLVKPVVCSQCGDQSE
ncbi:MAG TPA: hypothetical protein VFW25_04715 [Silvibacterium sp.]|nr:hypothetical protein [Silvibacterium sp.]